MLELTLDPALAFAGTATNDIAINIASNPQMKRLLKDFADVKSFQLLSEYSNSNLFTQGPLGYPLMLYHSFPLL